MGPGTLQKPHSTFRHRVRRWRSRCALGVVLAASVGWPCAQLPRHAVAAESETERIAHLHFRQGEAFYADGQFGEALKEYQAGFEAVPLPGFLVNIAQCQRRLGDLGHARASYQKFVLVAPDSPLAPEVRKLIAQIERLIAESEQMDSHPAVSPDLEPHADLSDEVLAPGEAAGGLSGAALLPSTRQAGGGKARSAGDEIASTLTEPPPAPEAHPSTSRWRWVVWSSIGAAVLGGTIAVIAMSRTDTPADIHDGTLGTLRR